MKFVLLVGLFSLIHSSLTNQGEQTDKVTKVRAKKQNGLVLVGVILQPMSNDLQIQFPSTFASYSYCDGSYVDWVQSAGTMAVLIPFDLDQQTLNRVLDGIQMVVFPGGDAPLVSQDGQPTAYQSRLNYILNYAKNINDKGRRFPVLGTCLGFEAMLIAEAGQNCSVLQGGFVDVMANHSLQVNATAVASSYYWSQFDSDTLANVTSSNTFFYYHEFGITPAGFFANPILADSYLMIGTSADMRGQQFVGSIEHKKYPFLANQWHPEESVYTRLPGNQFLDRSSQNVQFMTDFIQNVVNSVRDQGTVPSPNIDPLIWSLASSETQSLLNVYDGTERIYFERRIKTDAEILAESN